MPGQKSMIWPMLAVLTSYPGGAIASSLCLSGRLSLGQGRTPVMLGERPSRCDFF
jgi:hypothetical protein